MNIHVVCTGTELLIGHTLNTNLQYLGQALDAVGLAIRREVCVPDRADSIAAAVREELKTADMVITIGGLGPTSDDLTRDIIARELGAGLRFDPQVHQAILDYLGDRSANLPAAALRIQAMVPDNGVPLPNRNGTAPGLWCTTSTGKIVLMLPGPPRELQPMFAESALPRLKQLAPPEVVRKAFTVCAIPEAVVAERVEAVLKAEFSDAAIEPAYCARLYQVDVRLSAPPARESAVTAAWQRLRREFGPAVLPAEAAGLPAAVGELLLRHGLWLAAAESCTGGWISKTLTDVPGASAWFCGSVVSYSNDWKQNLLDVPADVLDTHGAVSAETAGAMLDALFRRYEADVGIAVTGIAGPSGGTAEKPVGLVYIATGVRGQAQVERLVFPGDRDSIRQRTVTVALNQLRLQLLKVFQKE